MELLVGKILFIQGSESQALCLSNWFVSGSDSPWCGVSASVRPLTMGLSRPHESHLSNYIGHCS